MDERPSKHRDGAAARRPWSPFAQGLAPEWASAWGIDTLGEYADLQVNDVVQRMRWIGSGSFWMGSPECEHERRIDEVRHWVTLSHGFWLADTVCTWALWTATPGGSRSLAKSERFPVVGVSWEQCRRFLEALNARYKVRAFRLPTEAEWEYACRAGRDTPFSWGEDIGPSQASYDFYHSYMGPHSDNGGVTGLVEVGSFPANPWGLHEMHGNVWEWCEDAYGDYPPDACSDPVASIGDRHVLRGGSWREPPRALRSAFRHAYAGGGHDHYGFRIAASGRPAAARRR